MFVKDDFILGTFRYDLAALMPLDFLYFQFGVNATLLRLPRLIKVVAFKVIYQGILTTKPLKDKAELLQLKPHPFICMRNFLNKKVGNQKN